MDKDGVILAFGTMLDVALKAADQLSEEGLSVRVVNARFIKPLDENMIKQIVKENIPILTIEEHALQGGFGSAVLEFIEQEDYLFPYVYRMGLPDYFVEHGSVGELLEETGLTVENVKKKIKRIVPLQKKRA